MVRVPRSRRRSAAAVTRWIRRTQPPPGGRSPVPFGRDADDRQLTGSSTMTGMSRLVLR